MSYRANKLFCPISQWRKIGKSGPVTLTFDLWPSSSLSFVRLLRNMFMQNFIALSAAVKELSCTHRKKTLPKTLQSVTTERTVTISIQCFPEVSCVQCHFYSVLWFQADPLDLNSWNDKQQHVLIKNAVFSIRSEMTLSKIGNWDQLEIRICTNRYRYATESNDKM